MSYEYLIKHIKQRLTALQQEQNALEKQREQLCAKPDAGNEDEIKAKLEETTLAFWECRGKQKAYTEMWEQIIHPPLFKLAESGKSSPRKSEASCPKCSGSLAVTTTIDAAPQPGYIIISSYYACQACGHHNQEEVCLPKEIALQEYNLEQLMKGV